MSLHINENVTPSGKLGHPKTISEINQATSDKQNVIWSYIFTLGSCSFHKAESKKDRKSAGIISSACKVDFFPQFTAKCLKVYSSSRRRSAKLNMLSADWGDCTLLILDQLWGCYCSCLSTWRIAVEHPAVGVLKAVIKGARCPLTMRRIGQTKQTKWNYREKQRGVCGRGAGERKGRGSGEIQTQENVKLRWNAGGIWSSWSDITTCILFYFLSSLSAQQKKGGGKMLKRKCGRKKEGESW